LSVSANLPRDNVKLPVRESAQRREHLVGHMVTSRSLLCSACAVGWIARVNRKRRERAARAYFLEAIADTIERLDHIELDVALP
jgi:hypothetical protein